MYKLVIRADDVGYTDTYNIGVWEAIDHGYVTSLDIMLDAPGAPDALKRIKNYPWLSMGWHTHFWCSPILPAEEVPTLVIPETGRFKHREELHGQDISYEEALKELRAEMRMCMELCGRVPDTAEPDRWPDTPFGKAINQVIAENGITYGYASMMAAQPDGTIKYMGPMKPEYKDVNLYIIDQRGMVAADVMKDSLLELEKYDPIRFLLEDRMKLHALPENSAIMHGFHPGYIDYFVARLGDYGPNMRYYTLSRVYDVEALCSQRLHDWIQENHIELCSQTDAIFGTHHYQQYLHHIGSDLCVLY